MSHRFAARPAALRFALLGTALLLASCGTGTPAPAQDQVTAPTSDTTVSSPTINAESTTPIKVQPGVASGGRTEYDAKAEGQQTVTLLGNGNAATFTVPSTGTFTAALQARETAYQGNVILSIRVNGAERKRVEITSLTYAPLALGDLSLTAGQVLSAVFVNDLSGAGGDRNAYIDYLTLTPVATTAPAPAPEPTPTPTPTPTPEPTPTPTPAPAPTDAVDVKTFGAKGDGVTDDTAALQKAASSGKSLIFPSGTYLVSRAVTFSGVSGLSYVGQGATIKAKSGFTGAALLHLSNTTNTTVRGFTVIGAGEGTGWIDGVRVSGGSGAVVDGNTISQLGGCGVYVENTTGTTVSTNTVSGVKYHGVFSSASSKQTWRGNRITGHGSTVLTGGIGLLGQLGGDYLIENNVVSAIGNTGMKTEGASNVVFRGNNLDGFATDGIKIMPLPEKGVSQVSNGVIENNTVRGFSGAHQYGSTALQISSVIGGRVSGNTTYGTFGASSGKQPPYGYEDAIRLQAHGSGPVPSGITVSDNKVSNSFVGMRLMGNDNTVANNTFQGSARNSVIFNRYASRNKFTGNTFATAGEMGVMFDLYVSGTTFSGNTFSGMSTGIYAANTGNNNNTFTTNSFSAVSKAIVYSGTSNTCSGNTGTGVTVTCQ
ncbi:right-handed parallel beta-helix repeat-containing protein [Deinococcus ficus]|uniref:right-handed parallel beta-helix repeat-containing protein n=1 Tax=Deinococcus ficus TaxID=317577 RepID=UPI00227D8E20|nr:right-handed parallel beta-helix repeat-containing protein [Deinococcus ficus]